MSIYYKKNKKSSKIFKVSAFSYTHGEHKIIELLANFYYYGIIG